MLSDPLPTLMREIPFPSFSWACIICKISFAGVWLLDVSNKVVRNTNNVGTAIKHLIVKSGIYSMFTSSWFSSFRLCSVSLTQLMLLCSVCSEAKSLLFFSLTCNCWYPEQTIRYPEFGKLWSIKSGELFYMKKRSIWWYLDSAVEGPICILFMSSHE